MNRGQIVQSLQALTQLEAVDLNRQAEELRQSIEKDLKELKTREADLKKFLEKAKNQSNQINERLHEILDQIGHFLKDVQSDDNIPSSKKKEIGSLAEGKMSNIQMTLDSFHNLINQAGLLDRPAPTTIPEDFFQRLAAYKVLEPTLRGWYKECAVGAAGFIPFIGKAISVLSFIHTLVKKPSGLTDFNAAVQSIGWLLVAKMARSFYRDFIIPQIKLNSKWLKSQINALIRIEQHKLSTVDKIVQEMFSSVK